jgi:hypothetical protein
MLAAPDLEAATADFERRTGVKPSEGGRHPGQGSRNVLAALGGRCYLEIIGPDLAQERTNNFGEVLSRLAAPVLLKYAVQTSDIDAPQARCRTWAVAAGVERSARKRTLRHEPRGPRRRIADLAPAAARLRQI